jgi:uncharacterized protein YgbK (DUF1537 family)
LFVIGVDHPMMMMMITMMTVAIATPAPPAVMYTVIHDTLILGEVEVHEQRMDEETGLLLKES